MKDVLARYVQENSNQYPSLMGLPMLRQALARHNKARCASLATRVKTRPPQTFYNLDVDWQTEVVITVGATEALAAALMGMLNDGDEVRHVMSLQPIVIAPIPLQMVVFDPQYDSYASICQRVSAKVVSVPLVMRQEGLTFDRARLAAAYSPSTKLLLLNTPHNPTGKVFTRDELEFIAQLVTQHDVYVILDEVYEHLVFPPQQHLSLRQLPGMDARCIRIGSAGKTFSFTAWKVCCFGVFPIYFSTLGAETLWFQ